MAFNLKVAADNLLALADRLDKEASEKTLFICGACGHEASLASINAFRGKLASEQGIGIVTKVSVNDKLACGEEGCRGVMAYSPTAESERFYVDAVDEESTDPTIEESEGELDESIFEPVDEQESEETPVEEVPEAPKPEGSEPSFEEMPTPAGPTNPANEDELMPEDEADQGKPQDIPEEAPAEESAPEEEAAPVEETPAEETAPAEETPTEEEAPVEEEAAPADEAAPMEEEAPSEEAPVEEGDDTEEVPSKKAPLVPEPKFTEMPEDMKDLKLKTASDRFLSSVKRYSI